MKKENRSYLVFGIVTLIVLFIVFANFSKDEENNGQQVTNTSSTKTEYTSPSTNSTKNSSKETYSDSSATNSLSDSSETATPKKEEESVKPTPKNVTKKDKSIRLFEKIYVPYAARENVFVFSSVKAYVKSSGFKCKITNPSKKDSGEIKVSNSNGDYVYFIFHSVNGLDLIMTVSYYHKKSDSEVSLSNYSSDNSARYDTLETHVIGEESEDVDSIEEQQEFLFSD